MGGALKVLHRVGEGGFTSWFTALINMEDLISTDIAEVPQVRWFLLLVVGGGVS